MNLTVSGFAGTDSGGTLISGMAGATIVFFFSGFSAMTGTVFSRVLSWTELDFSIVFFSGGYLGFSTVLTDGLRVAFGFETGTSFFSGNFFIFFELSYLYF